MEDEIKEILEQLEWYRKIGKKDVYYPECVLPNKKAFTLLDYITNLQEELKEYKMLFDAFSERPYAHRYLEEKKKELGNKNIIGLDSEMIYKDYYDLKEENKRLKEIEKEHKNCTRKHWQQKCAEHCANEMIYKSRNEKAIEKLETLMPICIMPNNTLIHGTEKAKTIEETLNILNGGDEE